MTDTGKVLGQADLAAVTPTDVYTAPAQATISAIIVANRTNAAITVRLSIAVAGAVAANKQYICYDRKVLPNMEYVVIAGITLAATDVIRAYASATGISVNIFGLETS